VAIRRLAGAMGFLFTRAAFLYRNITTVLRVTRNGKEKKSGFAMQNNGIFQ